MSFWQLAHPGERIAIIDANTHLSYQALIASVSTFEQHLAQFRQKTLGIIFCQNHLDSLVVYLASLRTGHAVFLIDANLHETLAAELINTYQPEWIVRPKANTMFMESYQTHEVLHDSLLYISKRPLGLPIHDDLALLLSTSGSTGSPKVVRLSSQNLSANAASIASYLQLSEFERPITTLPIHYAYGLSVINSHLHVGATLLLTQESISSESFWNFASQHKTTSLAGVPYTYQTLQRIRIENIHIPSLTSLTQAGGRLSASIISHFAKLSQQKAWRFYVMYGQTEATARISYIPPAQLIEKPDSIGQAIPQGKLSLDPSTSELIYEGPNVMMGYAMSRDDLSKGDEQHGVLKTGDIAKQDSDGFFTITGRSKRFLKIFGLRINLDEVETWMASEHQLQVAVAGNDDKLHIFTDECVDIKDIKSHVAKFYHLHATAIEINAIAKIPRNERGKIDYSQLTNLIGVS